MTPRDGPELLVVAGTVLTMEPGAAPMADTAVAVRDGRIVEIGPIDEMRTRHRGTREIGGTHDIALPGLINAHQHLTGDRLIRSMIPDDAEWDEAIFQWAVPAHAAHTGDDDELSSTLSLIESVCNGVTFTIEAGTVAHPDRVLAGYDAVGVRGTLGSWGWDVEGEPWAGTVDEVLDRQRHVVAITAGHDRVDGWVTLVGHDLMTAELAVAASDLARSEQTGMTFHLSPSDRDAASYLASTGKRPAVHLGGLGVFGPHILLGHGVHFDDAELDVLLDADVAIAYCPWAYLRLAQGVVGAGRHIEYLRRGGRVALGCDSENAGDAIDILSVAALTAGLAKDVAADPAAFTAHAALHQATLGGAEAIGKADELGSLEVGKRADIVLVDTSGPEWVPRSPDPVLQLVWASDGRCVRDVIVGGDIVVRDREPVHVDRAALAEAARDRHARLVTAAGLGR